MQKQYTTHQLPNVLALHLQRYNFVDKRTTAKISKRIENTSTISIKPYQSADSIETVTYQLKAVVNHAGATTKDGHYKTLAKSSKYC